MNLPADLKNFRADRPRMKQLAAVLAIVAVFMLIVTVHNMVYRDELLLEQQKLDNAQKAGEIIAGPYDVQRKLSSPIKYEEWICHAGDRVRYCKPVYRRTM